MFDWLHWLGQLENSKIVALILFFAAFCAIVIYVYTGKKRAKRLESYKYIPFQDEHTETDLPPRKVMENERKDHSTTKT